MRISPKWDWICCLLTRYGIYQKGVKRSLGITFWWFWSLIFNLTASGLHFLCYMYKNGSSIGSWVLCITPYPSCSLYFNSVKDSFDSKVSQSFPLNCQRSKEVSEMNPLRLGIGIIMISFFSSPAFIKNLI